MSTVLRRRRTLWLVAAVTLLIGLLSRMPASFVLSMFLPDQVLTRGVNGTIWSGTIDAAELNGISLGNIEWRLKPLAILTGRLRAQASAALPGGFVDGDFSVSASEIRIRDTKASLALAPITAPSSIGPSSGQARVSIDDARLRDLWPTTLRGELTLTDLRYPPVGTQPLGDYSITFADDDSNPAYPVRGDVTALDGPFVLSGYISLGDNRAYSMRARIAAKPGADAQLSQGLRILGPANAQGQHALSFDGNL